MTTPLTSSAVSSRLPLPVSVDAEDEARLVGFLRSDISTPWLAIVVLAIGATALGLLTWLALFTDFSVQEHLGFRFQLVLFFLSGGFIMAGFSGLRSARFEEVATDLGFDELQVEKARAIILADIARSRR